MRVLRGRAESVRALAKLRMEAGGCRPYGVWVLAAVDRPDTPALVRDEIRRLKIDTQDDRNTLGSYADLAAHYRIDVVQTMLAVPGLDADLADWVLWKAGDCNPAFLGYLMKASDGARDQRVVRALDKAIVSFTKRDAETNIGCESGLYYEQERGKPNHIDSAWLASVSSMRSARSGSSSIFGVVHCI